GTRERRGNVQRRNREGDLSRRAVRADPTRRRDERGAGVRAAAPRRGAAQRARRLARRRRARLASDARSRRGPRSDVGMDERAVVRRFLGIRIAFWIATAVTLIWSPIRNAANIPPFHAWFGLGDRFFDTFAQWDSGWFLGIAHHGYESKQAAAFFPLYPLLVRGVAEVVRSYVVAGVLVSLVAGAVAVVVLQ